MKQKMTSTLALCQRAAEVKARLCALSDEKINEALCSMADAIVEDSERILEENAEDMRRAKESVSEVMLDRLMLNRARLLQMAEGIREISRLPSALGVVLEEKKRPNGLSISKISVPIGVIAIIYESRPNVTSDAAALALKSGNAVVLRSGKEAYRSAAAITAAMKKGLLRAGVPENAVNLVSDTSRESANELMRANGLVDLLIPRGGKGLIRACVENASVPCLETGTGICHIYVDRSAELSRALDIIDNAKTSRPSVCNAAEVLLVHRGIAKQLLPLLKQRLADTRMAQGKAPVRLLLDEQARLIIDGERAGDADFDTEFLDYILAVKVVDSTEDAILHIARHSTHHSEAIVTEDEGEAEKFVQAVDSAAVYVNASTRFTDGGEFGLGCEMGISTQKLHARGPVGIRELTSYKYVIRGNGQIR